MLLSGYGTSDIVDVVMRRFGGCGDKDMHDRAFYHDRERFRKSLKMYLVSKLCKVWRCVRIMAHQP